MAIVYNFKNIIACIETLHPIQARDIQALAEARIRQFGEAPDPDACRWTSQKPGNCNIGSIRYVIINMTNISELQQIEDCARIIAVLDDEESSMSTSSQSTSSSSNSSLSTVDCNDLIVRSPQRYETDTSTAALVMDPLEANVYWDVVRLRGDLGLSVWSFRGDPGSQDNATANSQNGLITYTPEPDGSEAGSVVSIGIIASDLGSGCQVSFWLHITITEQTTD